MAETIEGGSMDRMERETLEGYQATLRGLRDTIGGLSKECTAENFDRLATCLEGLAGVVGDIVDKALLEAEHANAVRELMTPPPPRMFLQDMTVLPNVESDSPNGPWTPILPGAKPSKRYVTFRAPVDADPRD